MPTHEDRASHKSNLSSVPQGYVDSYSNKLITWEMVTGMEGYPDEGYYDTLANGALVYPSQGGKVSVLKAAWHWGSDCSVVNDPLGNKAGPHVCRPSIHLGSMDGDQMFSPFLYEGSLIGDSDGYT